MARACAALGILLSPATLPEPRCAAELVASGLGTLEPDFALLAPTQLAQLVGTSHRRQVCARGDNHHGLSQRVLPLLF